MATYLSQNDLDTLKELVAERETEPKIGGDGLDGWEIHNPNLQDRLDRFRRKTDELRFGSPKSPESEDDRVVKVYRRDGSLTLTNAEGAELSAYPSMADPERLCLHMAVAADEGMIRLSQASWEKFGGMMTILCPILILFGVAQLFGLF